jgi:hypothetical protein
MPTETEVPSQACWSQDRLDSGLPPVAEAPYFDDKLDAWVFSRYADVAAALRIPSLVPASIRNRTPQTKPDYDKHRRMRAETVAALPSAQLRAWKKPLAKQAEDLAGRLAVDRKTDLLGEYARPLCLSMAATVTHIQQESALALCERARAISAAASDPYDSALRAAGKFAETELRPHFRAEGPESLRDAGFVALSQTMPALLGNTWFTLLEHPQHWQRLHREPSLTEPAIEELMRYAGFTRTLNRQAVGDIDVGGVRIRKSQYVVLRLVAANRDPDSFANPHEIDLERRGALHLSFGTGLHSCVGAGLLRMIASTLTLALVTRFAEAELAGEIEWRGGATFVSPKALWVNLRMQVETI